MASKIGRNDPCPCGSGKKYKYCHSKIKVAIPFEDIKESFNKTFEKQYCIVPSVLKNKCNGKIIKAHTIQKSGVLELISKDRHVYHIGKDPLVLFKKDKIEPTLVGINNASTFTGFCAYHDNEIFKELENNFFNPNDRYHYFLLAYRSLCRELFTKNAQKEHLQHMKIVTLSKLNLNKQNIDYIFEPFEIGVSLGLRDTTHQKYIYDNILISKDYSNVCYYAIEFNEIPEIMCSGFYNPPYDFNNEIIQDMSNHNSTTDYISYSLIALNGKGYCVFTWIKDLRETNTTFVKSLNDSNRNIIPNMLIKYTLETFENIVISPIWYDNLSDSQKTDICNLILESPYLKIGRRENVLRDVNDNYVNWTINNIYSNVTFN